MRYTLVLFLWRETDILISVSLTNKSDTINSRVTQNKQVNMSLYNIILDNDGG